LERMMSDRIEPVDVHLARAKADLKRAAITIERLTAELNEAADATGIAGVDEPMSLLQCIQSLRAELEGYKSALIGHGWIITSVDVDKYGQIGTGGGASK